MEILTFLIEIGTIIIIILSILAVFFDIILLIIYFKNGVRSHLTQYKIILILICLLDSLCNLSIDSSYFDTLFIICEITGTLKTPLVLGTETTQLSLLLITYFSFKHSLWIDKHSKQFKIIIFLQCFLPVIIVAIEEFFDFFTQDIERGVYCSKVETSVQSCYIIFLLICYILFIIFLIKLYLSLNHFRTSNSADCTKLQQYKKQLKKYLFGFIITFPNLLWFLFLIVLNILSYFPSIDFEIDTMETIRYYVIIFSFINTGFSPIVVIIIYCFSKEHFKFIKGMFCCCLKKEEQLSVNITKEAA